MNLAVVVPLRPLLLAAAVTRQLGQLQQLLPIPWPFVQTEAVLKIEHTSGYRLDSFSIKHTTLIRRKVLSVNSPLDPD